MENSTESDLNKSPSESGRTADRSSESVWGKIKFIFPYLSAFIILLGLIKIGVYYWCFNIGIQDYIGVSELILAIANKAVGTLTVVSSFAFFSWNINKMTPLKEKRIEMIEQNKPFNKIFAFEIIMLSLLLILGIFSFAYGMKIMVFILGPTMTIPLYQILIYDKRLASYKPLVFVFLLVIVTVLIICLDSIQDANYSENGKYLGTKIYTKDSTYISDSTHFYIGKTTDFYFIYNKDRKSATIIPEREVLKFELKESKISIPISKMKGLKLDM